MVSVDVSFHELDSADSVKILVVLFSMTIHSFAEGVAIGVALANERQLITHSVLLSLGIHNVPEVCLFPPSSCGIGNSMINSDGTVFIAFFIYLVKLGWIFYFVFGVVFVFLRHFWCLSNHTNALSCTETI